MLAPRLAAPFPRPPKPALLNIIRMGRSFGGLAGRASEKRLNNKKVDTCWRLILAPIGAAYGRAFWRISR